MKRITTVVVCLLIATTFLGCGGSNALSEEVALGMLQNAKSDLEDMIGEAEEIIENENYGSYERLEKLEELYSEYRGVQPMHENTDNLEGCLWVLCNGATNKVTEVAVIDGKEYQLKEKALPSYIQNLSEHYDKAMGSLFSMEYFESAAIEGKSDDGWPDSITSILVGSDVDLDLYEDPVSGKTLLLCEGNPVSEIEVLEILLSNARTNINLGNDILEKHE